MVTKFRIDATVDETAIWEMLRHDGSVNVVYGNGIEERLTGPVYWISPENFNDDDDVNECEFNFIAGYASENGRHTSSSVGIPSKILATMFVRSLPSGMTIDWNAAEATHVVETRSAMTVRDAKDIIVPILQANGFRPLP